MIVLNRNLIVRQRSLVQVFAFFNVALIEAYISKRMKNPTRSHYSLLAGLTLRVLKNAILTDMTQCS